MANQLNNFEKLVKESYEGYEVPFDPMHWDEFEEEFNAVAPGLTGYFSAITTGLAAVGIVFVSMLFFFSDATHKNYAQTQEDIEQVENNGNGTGMENTLVLSEELDTANTENTAELSEVSEAESIAEAEVNVKQSAKTSSKETLASNSSSEKSTTIKSNIENKGNKKIRTGCTGMIIKFEASEQYGSDAKYLWNFGDGFFSNEANPTHTFNKEGVFDVSLSVTSHSTGQITSNVVQAMIEVVEAPKANLSVEITGPQTIALRNKSFNESDVEWTVDGEDKSHLSAVNLSIADNTRYNVVLNAINESGCSDTLLSTVNSIDAGPEFPRAYGANFGSPFAPGAIIDDGTVSSVKIYESATGKLVFEGSGNEGWSGTTANGNKAEKGKYLWVMAVNKENGINIYRGAVELR